MSTKFYKFLSVFLLPDCVKCGIIVETSRRVLDGNRRLIRSQTRLRGSILATGLTSSDTIHPPPPTMPDEISR
nr:MAG TPA: hypothetical protein [Caudoviricetes sp.]